jgi:ubiquinone/menaquinone biosynthesis C-methylase UbiE
VITPESHYAPFAAAYVRGALREPALDDEAALARGAAAGLDLHRFKRSAQLPRVRAVLGALRGFAPDRLVDLGSGRGAFVWPLLDALPHLPITATDLLERRMAVFAAVARGGIERLSAVRADMTALPFADASCACVTALEVLEHLPGDGPERAAREALRVAHTAVIATVPSHEDDNPEHVHLFDGPRLGAMFRAAGARRVTIEHVLNHIIVVALR